mmetsp:Transcript_30967/g.72217  ORF Transcript_30967/g.72217 Transcript_30967/m.72217 type:complete len:370 (+) Transcript_30967:1258-2367(+)
MLHGMEQPFFAVVLKTVKMLLQAHHHGRAIALLIEAMIVYVSGTHLLCLRICSDVTNSLQCFAQQCCCTVLVLHLLAHPHKASHQLCAGTQVFVHLLHVEAWAHQLGISFAILFYLRTCHGKPLVGRLLPLLHQLLATTGHARGIQVIFQATPLVTRIEIRAERFQRLLTESHDTLGEADIHGRHGLVPSPSLHTGLAAIRELEIVAVFIPFRGGIERHSQQAVSNVASTWQNVTAVLFDVCSAIRIERASQIAPVLIVADMSAELVLALRADLAIIIIALLQTVEDRGIVVSEVFMSCAILSDICFAGMANTILQAIVIAGCLHVSSDILLAVGTHVLVVYIVLQARYYLPTTCRQMLAVLLDEPTAH